MIRKHAASALLTAVALQASLAHGLGLGDITLRSALDEPLDAEIRLRGAGDLGPSQILIRLGSASDFDRAGVDRVQFLSDLRFEVRLDDRGDGVVHVSTDRPVVEPYLDFIVEARWPSGRVLREYTVLLDLPTYTEASSAAASPPTAARRVEGGLADDGGLAPGADQYRVRSGDTLWRIASRARPGGVSVQQMMNAIHRDNPQAFFGGDIDRLRAGEVLRLPQGSEINELSDAPVAPAAQAAQAAQATSTGEPATVPVATQVPEATSAAGDAPAEEPAGDGYLAITGDAQVPAGEAAAGGEASDPEAAAADGVAAAGEELTAAQESLLAAERANAELQARVAALEAQVADFQKLADIEKKGQEHPAAAAEPAGFVQRILDSTLTWLVLASVMLAAMVAFLARRRRTVSDFVPAAFGGARAEAGVAEPVARATGAGGAGATTGAASSAPAIPAPPVPAPPAVTDAGDVTDPVSEADIYLAYGRADRAEEILREALRAHGDDGEVRLKLMEIVAARGDEGEFLRHYGALGGNVTAQQAARTILEQHERLPWIDAAAPAAGAALAAVALEPALNRDQPLQIDLAAELQQVADTLGGTDARPATSAGGEHRVLLAKTEQAIARAAAELDLGAESLATADTFDGELGELDLSLDLDDLGAAEGPDVEHGGDELPEFDLPLGELELDASATATADAALDADLALLDGSDETTTKLDLARAYLDMGDLDGARDILEEVEQEGNATQREEAATLLARVRGTH